MKALILGGAGMLGAKLAQHLLTDDSWQARLTNLDLLDVVTPSTPAAPNVPAVLTRALTGSLTNPKVATQIAAERYDFIFHLAAIVSGEAEQDFAKGWQINAMGSWHLLEALRHAHEQSGGSYRPRLVFASSIAVFGPPFPDLIPDDFHTAPLSSYGAQKAMTELLVSDHSRKGHIDGISLRLPTICVRPGKPNAAASSFYSGIIREPLAGQRAVLPVDPGLRHWFASPRSAIGFLAHAANVETGQLSGRRALNLPGVSCTIEEQIEALRDVAGEEAVALIDHKPDPNIQAIVNNWPQAFDPQEAKKLGFAAETDFRQIIETYISEDMPS
ncbi:MAG: D-erythronate dehydrogenase [Pseudomonadota bacterium]